MGDNMKNEGTLYLIDGSSYIYRAFFAIRRLSNSKGLPTNAIFGFVKMVNKVINDLNPEYLSIVFDAKGKNFRHDLYKDYKATRKKMDDELKVQVPYIKEIVKAYNIPSIELEGYEADDIIATFVENLKKNGRKIVIISGDKDLMQLVTEDVTMLDTMKDKEYRVKDVIERFRVPPERVRDVLGLAGDSSDNIPGVPGIGPKTASALIEEFGSMEELFKRIDEVKGKKRDTISANREKAFLSKKLVTLDHHVPIKIKLDELTIKEPDYEKLTPLLKELEFTRLLADLPDKSVGKTISYDDYHTVKDKGTLAGIIAKIREKGAFAVDLETTSCDPMLAEIVGISICHTAKNAYYIPVAHTAEGSEGQLDREYVLTELKSVLEDKNIRKIGQNIKYEYVIFKRCGIELSGRIDDTMVASYLLNPAKRNHNLTDICMEYLDHKMIEYKEVAGSGKSEVTFDKVSVAEACTYSAEDSDVTFMLAEKLIPMLDGLHLTKLYEDIEIPLIKVLADMEMSGVLVDEKRLNELSKKFEKSMKALETDIYKEAGEEFNINSTKQLAVILFDKLKMPVIKKTKTGYSTDVSVLTKLAEVYEFKVPKDILRFRSLAKLKSTYTDALVSLINPDTKRIHTSYNQTVTSTGRLSSSDPNLQNIPVRSEEGKLIRETFIAGGEGKVLISADYSQVELRILADFSGDEIMLASFENNEDVHTRTAAEVFEIFPQMVTPDMRRAAKVINFGLIYGMSAFGLSQELKITPALAKKYIDGYFNKYKKVKAYIDKMVENAHKNGYVTTLFNRRLNLPDINSRNRNVMQMAERNAINAPIQGTAADIIKIAMINLYSKMKSKRLKSRMLLQVHDELVFEVVKDEINIMERLIREEMEGAGSPFIKIPLKVSISRGVNWAEAH
jgi:DNA polymerase-1